MNNERLNNIYDKTDGNCHICHGKLCFSNYVLHRTRGAWEVEHSKPRSKGGTDNLNNLFAAHIICNREKATLHTRTVRSWYGNTHAPYSKQKKQTIKAENAILGAIDGGFFASLFSPKAIVIGAAVGAAIGSNSSPRK